MVKRVHAILKGRVQGVFFRDFVEKRAFLYKLKGFVRNLPDGNLEIVAEGDEGSIKTLLEECKRGPMLAKVDDVEIEQEQPTGEFSSFEVRY